ncbi:MAG: hypothetical protein Q4G59_07700, partial [Planctomycetia bacterium]|nr:hypothetical protein [Planctomycetia bacterium]
MKRLFFTIFALNLSTVIFALDGFQNTVAPSGDILATGSERVCIFAPDGSVKWEHPTGNNADAWYLPNGNVLFADGSCWEINPKHEVVWSYKPQDQTGGGAFSCQRLPNGNTVVGENSTGRILELTKENRIVTEFSVPINKKNRHQTMRMVRKLENGNFLVCHSGKNTVIEYTVKGEVVWEQKVPGLAFAAVRLADGSTLISSLD